MTFQQILTSAEADKITKDTIDVDNLDQKSDTLDTFFNNFFPFLDISNEYTINGLPLVFGKYSQKEEKDRMLLDISKLAKTELFINLKKDRLKVSFMINDLLQPQIKVSYKQEFADSSIQFVDQELAAKHLATIFVKNKD